MYTLFFSAEDALRMKLDMGVEAAFFGFVRKIMTVRLGVAQECSQGLQIVFFWDVVVNLVDIGLIGPLRPIVVLEQQVHLYGLAELPFQAVDHLPGLEILVDEGFQLDPPTFGSFPCLDKPPSLLGLLVDI